MMFHSGQGGRFSGKDFAPKEVAPQFWRYADPSYSVGSKVGLPPSGNMDWVREAEIILIHMSWRSQIKWDDDAISALARDFDPDLIHWPSGANGAMFLRLGAGFTRGGVEYQELSSRDTVSFYSGNGIERNLQGELAEYTAYGGGLPYFACHNALRWHNHVKESILDLVGQSGIVAILQDNIGFPGFIKGGNCFCEWCEWCFKDYLQAKYSAQQLLDLGIPNLENFTIKDHILIMRKGQLGEGLLQDPVIREFILFQYLAQLGAWKNIVSAVISKSENTSLLMPMGGNQAYSGPQPYGVLLSRINNVITIEQDYNLAGYPGLRNGMLSFKVFFAAGDYQKPVWAWNFPKKSVEGKREALYSPDFLSLMLSEAQANGGVCAIPVCKGAPLKDEPWDLPLSEKCYRAMVEYASFTHQYRPLFKIDREAVANVGIVYSIPTLLFHHFPALKIWTGWGGGPHFSGFARALEDMHVPFEVVIFGHPTLWNDSIALSNLGKYRLLILPSVECLSDRQIDALRTFSRNGGRIICTGELGAYDEQRNPRATPFSSEIESGSGVVKLLNEDSEYYHFLQTLVHGVPEPSEPECLRAIKNVVFSSLQESLLLETDASRLVSINIWRQNRRVSVHLVNYNLTLDGTLNLAPETRVRLRLPNDFTFNSIVVVTPERGIEEIKYIHKDGWVEVQVPPFKVHSILVIGQKGELEAACYVSRVNKLARRLTLMGASSKVPWEGVRELQQAYMEVNYAKAIRMSESVEKELRNEIARLKEGRAETF